MSGHNLANKVLLHNIQRQKQSSPVPYWSSMSSLPERLLLPFTQSKAAPERPRGAGSSGNADGRRLPRRGFIELADKNDVRAKDGMNTLCDLLHDRHKFGQCGQIGVKKTT